MTEAKLLCQFFGDIPPAGSVAFRLPGDAEPFPDVQAITPRNFTVTGDGRLALIASVSGQMIRSGNYPAVPFGPEDWTFIVTGSAGISVSLSLAVDGHTADYPPLVHVTDLTGPDALALDKYADTGRAAKAAALVTAAITT